MSEISGSPAELKSPEDFIKQTDLLIDVDCALPFVIDENTSIECEVKSTIMHMNEMIKTYLFRILIIFIVLLGVLYFQGILMFMSDTYYMSTARIPLPDRIHELLEPYNHPFTPTFCNSMMFVFVWAGIFRVILFTPMVYTFQMTLRYVSLFGTAYFFRGFFVYMTTLPSCYYNCTPDLEKKAFFPFFLRIIGGYMGIVTNCTDLIISGHTMFTMITCILFCQNVKHLITKIVLVLISGFVLFLIIACKYHYTIDVLFGLALSGLLHYYYFTKVDDIGVHVYNKIYNSSSKAFRDARRTVIRETFLARFIVKMELLEERMVLGQKMRVLYDLVNGQKDLIDPKLLKKFNRYVRLFGADETDDLLALYRGSRKFNFYYWTSLYRMIFKRNKNVPAL